MSSHVDAAAFLASLSSALLAIYIYYNIKVFSFWSSRGVKGPRPWPIFGTNIHYFFNTKIELEGRWLKEYGNTVGLYNGYYPELLTIDHNIIKHVFIKEHDSFVDHDTRFIHNDNQRNWLLFMKGDKWNNSRALVTPMFTANKMRLMFGTISSVVDRFIAEADRRILNEQKKILGGRSADEVDELTRAKSLIDAARKVGFSKEEASLATVDVIAQTFYSLSLDPFNKQEEFSQRLANFSTFYFPWFVVFQFIPNQVAAKLKLGLVRFTQFEYFDKLSQSALTKRRKQAIKGNDIIQSLMDARLSDRNTEGNIFSKDDDTEAHYNDKIDHKEMEQIQSEQVKQSKLFRQFTETEIRGLMTFFIIAGFDTTAAAISYTMCTLARNPDYQDEVYQEIREKFEQTKGSLQYSDLTCLQKLDALVSEVLRLYSPILVHNRLCTNPEGVVLPTEPPVHLPANISVYVNTYHQHRNPEYFDRPEEFVPSRFYPENRDKIKSCTYMPFGGGRRNCVGMRLALMELKLFVTKILLKYSVEPGPKTEKFPPEIQNHMIFLQLKETEFKLIPRMM